MVLRDAPEDKVVSFKIYTLLSDSSGILRFDCEFSVFSLSYPPINSHVFAYISCFMK